MKKFFVISVLALAGLTLFSCKGKSLEEKCADYYASKCKLDSLEEKVNDYYAHCQDSIESERRASEAEYKAKGNDADLSEIKSINVAYATASSMLEKDKEKDLAVVQNKRKELDARWYQYYDRLSNDEKFAVGIRLQAFEHRDALAGGKKAIEAANKLSDDNLDKKNEIMKAENELNNAVTNVCDYLKDTEVSGKSKAEFLKVMKELNCDVEGTIKAACDFYAAYDKETDENKQAEMLNEMAVKVDAMNAEDGDVITRALGTLGIKLPETQPAEPEETAEN